MKNILLAFVFVFAISTVIADNVEKNNPSETSSSAAATATVSGNVVDFESGESLAGAEVTIEGTNIVTYTDLDGNFVFENLKAGNYTMTIRYISYKNSLVENMSVSTSTQNTVQVQLMPESN
ncbi:MAG: carboxypeptidase-like regulatory domain-containing protein [Bacteroidales bacterium]|nr:carboxypeptidase-like regulatory domain-containing protein [Bacteroidales bacterium]